MKKVLLPLIVALGLWALTAQVGLAQIISKSSLDTIAVCQTAMDDRERMDAASTAQDNDREIALARATIEDFELCQAKLPAGDRFDRDEALIVETYAMETLDAFAMRDSAIANAQIMLANIESNIELICADSYRGQHSARRLR